MDRDTFHSWLDSYGRARMERDPDAAASLYASDGTYQVTPFQEPMRGRKAIFGILGRSGPNAGGDPVWT